MNIGEQIRYMLRIRGLTQRWLANEMQVDEKTLSGKLTRNFITADELLTVANLLDMDLNKMKRGENIMFNWLIGTYFCYEDKDGVIFNCEVVDIDSANRIVARVEDTQKENYDGENIVIDIFVSDVRFQFNHFDGWKDKLYEKLLTKNKLTFHSISTESGDNWAVEIYRSEVNLGESRTGLNITVVNYMMVGYDGIEEKVFTTTKDKENKDDFVKWIKELAESTDKFNDDESGYVTMNAITFEESQIAEEELKLLYDLHYEANRIK